VPGAADVQLGPGSVIDPDVLLGYPSGRPGVIGETRIGRAARIRSGSVIYAAVDIGEDFETGHHVIVREENRIGSHCTVWNNSTIDYGCVIGEHALVGAGSVVTHDVPPGVAVAGNPARVIGPVDSIECPFGIVIPYVDGIDVRGRPEWTTVPPLPRPITKPTKDR